MNQASWRALCKARRERIQTLWRGGRDTDQGLLKPLPSILEPSGNVEVTIRGAYGGRLTAYSWPVYNALWEGGVGKVQAPFLSKIYLDPRTPPFIPETLPGSLQQAMQMSVTRVCLVGGTNQPGLCLRGYLSGPDPIGQLLKPTQSLGSSKQGEHMRPLGATHRQRRKAAQKHEGTGPTAAMEELPLSVETQRRGRGSSGAAPGARSLVPHWDSSTPPTRGISGMVPCYSLF